MDARTGEGELKGPERRPAGQIRPILSSTSRNTHLVHVSNSLSCCNAYEILRYARHTRHTDI